MSVAKTLWLGEDCASCYVSRKMTDHDLSRSATGNALKLDQVAYIEAGADHVLAKPVMLKYVWNRLRRLA